MVATFAGLGCFLAAILLHFLAVRLVPALARPLVLLVAVVLAAAVAGLAWATPAAAVYAALLAGGLTLSYLLLYIGVEHDSPTLALAGYIADHGPEGMPEAEVESFIASHPFTGTRVGKLVEHRIIALEGGRYRLRGHLGAFVGIAHLYRRLAGMDKASG